MDISLVIPTHERLLGVLNLLRSVTSQQLHNLEVEIIVVSNLHDPKLESAIQKLNLILPVHYTFTGIVGVNSARNEGIKRSVSDLVLFLDDDLFLKDPLYLQKLYTYATKYPEAGAIGGRYDLPSNHNLVDKAYHNISDSWMSQGKKINGEAINLIGGNTLYNKKILGHLLLFNENITFGGAETELNLKLFQAGMPMMLFEDIALEHHTSLTTRNLLKKAYRQGLGRAYHEKVVKKQIWSNHDISGIQSRHELTGSAISIYLQSLLIFWFDLFFRVGYRNGKLSDGKPSSTLFFAKCFFIELLELDPEVKMITPNDSTSSIKQESLISLVFKKIFGKIQGKLWMVPWFYNWKLKPFFARLFSGFWRVPWFFRWKILIRLDAFAKRLWVFPWFFNHKIMPVVRVVSSKVWLLPWFIKWKVIPALLFWRQLPWWKIPWFFRNKIFAQLWRVPVFIKYRVFAHTWLITWFIKWRLLPISLFLLIFSISMFFPVNTIGLATFYAASLSELERFIKKPWSES